MSFFDEDVDTRRRASSRPRRTGPPRGPSSDHQTLLVRRGVAVGGALLLLVLLALVVNSCRSNAREDSLKDYNREASAIARASETEVAAPFFRSFGEGADGSPTDLQTAISSLRVEAENHLQQAEDLDVPDEMVPAQRSLLIALELRRDALDFIAQRIRPALGDEGDAADEAITEIAGQMQSFLASDVVYRARVAPLIDQAFDDAEIGGQEISRSRFLPSLVWLSPDTVGQRLGGAGGGGDEDQTDREPSPGRHGTGLESVSVGELTLEPGAANRIPAGGPPTFDIRFTNQGESDEQDVRVDVRITPAGGGQAIAGSDTVDTIARGASATASVRLPRAPAAGQPVTVRVRVRPVPGEEMTENNEQEYPAQFTG
ncbi:MAG: hypothetical protein M3P50_13575 [Actinomycetota bacterium]|nr:hypothetical protein [Actinomycetota bacterium]